MVQRASRSANVISMGVSDMVDGNQVSELSNGE